jgi:hypothetical protein
MKTLVAFTLTLLISPQSLAAPFTDAEIEKRIARGAQLSVACRVEAELNNSVNGENCENFFYWIHDGFSLDPSNLHRAASLAAGDFETYQANLRLILAIAEGEERTAQGSP